MVPCMHLGQGCHALLCHPQEVLLLQGDLQRARGNLIMLKVRAWGMEYLHVQQPQGMLETSGGSVLTVDSANW